MPHGMASLLRVCGLNTVCKTPITCPPPPPLLWASMMAAASLPPVHVLNKICQIPLSDVTFALAPSSCGGGGLAFRCLYFCTFTSTSTCTCNRLVCSIKSLTCARSAIRSILAPCSRYSGCLSCLAVPSSLSAVLALVHPGVAPAFCVSVLLLPLSVGAPGCPCRAPCPCAGRSVGGRLTTSQVK